MSCISKCEKHITKCLKKMHSSNSKMMHTIRKVNFHPKIFTIFLVKSKLSTAKKAKPTTFSRVFHPQKHRQFSREIKVEFWDKKWRFWTVCDFKMIFIFLGEDAQDRSDRKILMPWAIGNYNGRVSLGLKWCHHLGHGVFAN